MIGIKDKTTLHTLVWINGVKFHKCPIDTGSEVNLISVKDAIKHGFLYVLTRIKQIKGVNKSVVLWMGQWNVVFVLVLVVSHIAWNSW